MWDWQQGLKANRKIRDPLYGYVYLNEDERRIIDTPIFQRLRRVGQLALTKYVYPAAEHSRFVHSLGAMHCATQIFTGIVNNSAKEMGLDHGDMLTSLRRLRFAALLHDIGHVAFSHAAEKMILSPLKHEHLGRHIIENYAPIADVLDEHATPVIGILSEQFLEKYQLLHQIISGHLDADRADYLMRDSHACGVKYGEYDVARYMQAFGATRQGGMLKLFVNERDVFVVEAFLMARYHYNMQVPYHRTRTGYDLVLKRFLGEFLHTWEEAQLGLDVANGRFTRADIDKFEWFDDYTIFGRIKEQARAGNPWANMLLRGGHLCPVYDTTSKVRGAKRAYKTIIEKLKAAGLCEGEDFFHWMREEQVSKLIAANDEGSGSRPNQETIYVRTKDAGLVDIMSYSPILSALRPVTIYRIYTTETHRLLAEELVRKTCRKTR